MSEIFLDEAEIDPSFEQVCGPGVPIMPRAALQA